MSKLSIIGAATAGILKTLMAPQVGRDEMCDAIGYIENAGVPTSVVPAFVGQKLFDTVGKDWYVAYDLSVGNWAPDAINTVSLAELLGIDGLLATADELNRAADVSTRIVNVTTATLTVTELDHDGKTMVLDRAAGIAVTLPAAAPGLKFRFIVKTDFAGASTIKSVAGADIMIGHALMGNNTDNSVVDWPSVAASTNDTIDLFGTANSTGGLAGQEITIEGLATNLWYVSIRGDAAGAEATPFANTVA